MMSETPFFSIGIPVYNKEKYISKCLDSILSQGFEDFELIIIDDGSQDGSMYIAGLYREKDKRIKLLSKKTGGGGGPSSVRNFFHYEAVGSYIISIDADDQMCENALQNAYDAAVKNNMPDIIHAGYIKRIGEKMVKYPVVKPDENDFSSTLGKDEEWAAFFINKRPVMQHPTKFINREFLHRSGVTFSSRLYAQEDHDFVYELCRKASSNVYSDFYSYYYFKEIEGSISTEWSYRAVYSGMSRWFELFMDLELQNLSEKTRQKFLELKIELISLMRLYTLTIPSQRTESECFKLIYILDHFFGEEIKKELPYNGKSLSENVIFMLYRIFGLKNGFKILYNYLKLKGLTYKE